MYSWFNPPVMWSLGVAAFAGRVGVLLSPVVRFGLGRRDVADGLQQAMVVEPRDPLQRGQFDRLARLPRPAPMDDLGLEQPVDGLGQRVEPSLCCDDQLNLGCEPRSL
jgi:hypothetical protein